jgi:multisubunit Na+/H+ antiporter MnhC subunit
MKSSSILGVVAALISIGAGIYMLQSSSASPDTTVFDVLMHGIGAYCIARGVWMLHEMRAIVSPEEKPTSMVGKSFRLDSGNSEG